MLSRPEARPHVGDAGECCTDRSPRYGSRDGPGLGSHCDAVPRNEHACEPVRLARAQDCRMARRARPHPGHPGAGGHAGCLRGWGPRGRDRDDGNVFGGGLGGLLGQRVSYREVLGLIVIQELTCKEAATVCGCAVGTVRTRMSWARAALKQTFLDQRCSVGSPPTRQADVPLAVAVVSPAFGIEGAAPGCSGSARPSAPADTL